MSLSIPSPGAGQQDKSNRLHLSFTGKLIILISLIAIGAVALAVYAFEQKKEVNRQIALAQQKTMEALQKEKELREALINVDTNRQNSNRREQQALVNARKALELEEIAKDEAMNARAAILEREKERLRADQEKLHADQQRRKAEKKTAEADTLKIVLTETTKNAEDQRKENFSLQELKRSRDMAKESILLFNENNIDSSKSKALQAFLLNSRNNGPHQNNDIYQALNINWAKSINYKNVSLTHHQPVHCVTGMAGIIFTADESGMICESVIKNGSLQKMASKLIEGKVRALAVSPDRKKLIAITSTGTGHIFNITASGFEGINTFKFSGIGKSVVFNNNENFILLSSEGIGQYSLTTNLIPQPFITRNGINALAIGKSGKCYVGYTNYIKIYKNWDDLVKDVPGFVQKFDTQISSIAIDPSEEYIAAGTNNGFVWINKLTADKGADWYRKLHLSAVRDVAFAVIEKDKIQLASAGADQTIKLVDVKAALQLNSTEDIITLNGHSKWIWKLYYANGGQFLLSTGEDNRVMAWKPSMTDLYQTLKK